MIPFENTFVQPSSHFQKFVISQYSTLVNTQCLLHFLIINLLTFLSSAQILNSVKARHWLPFFNFKCLAKFWSLKKHLLNICFFFALIYSLGPITLKTVQWEFIQFNGFISFSQQLHLTLSEAQSLQCLLSFQALFLIHKYLHF